MSLSNTDRWCERQGCCGAVPFRCSVGTEYGLRGVKYQCCHLMQRKEHFCVFLDNLACSAAVDLGQSLQLSLAIIGLLLEEGRAFLCVCVMGTSPGHRNAAAENTRLAQSFSLGVCHVSL